MTTPTERPSARGESLFRLTAEASPNAMLTVDRDQRIVFVNRGTERLFGYDRAELLGRSLAVLVPGRFSAAHAAHVEGYFDGPEVTVMGHGRDVRAVRKDGTEILVGVLLTPIEAEDGRFTLASITDLGAREREEQRLRMMVEAAPYALALEDGDGVIAVVNQKTERQFGYARAELVGRPLGDLIPERLRDAFHAAFFGAAGPPTLGVDAPLFGLRRDGSELPIEVGRSPIDTPEGPFVLASLLDVSERKRHEDELRRSNAELEQFAYIASHDLQEPLRMVASYTELLGQRYRGQLDDKADRYIHYAVDGAKRMQRLVADLLAFSRVGSQGKPLVPVSVERALGQVLAFLAPTIRDAGATVEHGPLPLVLADEGQLVQLLQNLVGNALKFRGEAAPRVVVSARRERDRWRLSVADNGIGIEPQYHARIFQMFQRLHERGRYEGSGIGLAIARRIVERHGGVIELESAPGLGSTFHCTLPAVPAAVDAPVQEPR